MEYNSSARKCTLIHCEICKINDFFFVFSVLYVCIGIYYISIDRILSFNTNVCICYGDDVC